VHYHFKTKDALLEAVIRRHGASVLKDLLDGVETLASTGEQPTPRQIVECVAHPYYALLQREPMSGSEWVRIVAELAVENDPRVEVGSEQATTAIHALVAQCFPQSPPQRRILITGMAIATLLQNISRGQGRTTSTSPASASLTPNMVIDFVAGGLAAAAASDGQSSQRFSAW
jgi:AcrR family transcriptional regulator